MPAPKDVIWPLEPHTRAKHEILRRYLEAWLPIMTAYNGRVVFLDGFAGPGEYVGGELGSPLIAIDTFLRQRHPMPGAEVTFLFIEKDSDRCQHLQDLLATRHLPSSAQWQVFCGEFDEHLASLLQMLEENSLRLAPTFAFVDPFGYSATPLKTIARLMQHDKCEVLITFMHEEVNRFLSFENAANESHYDNLFGTPEWRRITQQPLTPGERERQLHDLYQHQLSTVGGAKFVRSFRMRNRKNHTDYFLFFGTKSTKGLDKMKQAMWRVDPSGAYDFSDHTNPDQQVLFAPKPDYRMLQTMLEDRFRGQTVSIGDIGSYVITETPFHSSQYKSHVLKPMEKDGRLIVIEAATNRPAGTFADPKMRVRFG
jgi:three-Cys-motif partner protein